MLLARLVDAGRAVEEDLDRLQDRRQKCPLALEHAGHEAAERDDKRGEHREIDRDLKPTVDGHDLPLEPCLELLRPQQGVGEIDEERRDQRRPQGRIPGT